MRRYDASGATIGGAGSLEHPRVVLFVKRARPTGAGWGSRTSFPRPGTLGPHVAAGAQRGVKHRVSLLDVAGVFVWAALLFTDWAKIYVPLATCVRIEVHPSPVGVAPFRVICLGS